MIPGPGPLHALLSSRNTRRLIFRERPSSSTLPSIQTLPQNLKWCPQRTTPVHRIRSWGGGVRGGLECLWVGVSIAFGASSGQGLARVSMDHRLVAVGGGEGGGRRAGERNGTANK